MILSICVIIISWFSHLLSVITGPDGDVPANPAIGPIVGGAVGGVVGIGGLSVVLVVVLVCFLKKKREEKDGMIHSL